eukprot:scaffold2934_cov176-Amphora_coffeaeformis.AAC.1
MSHLTPGLTVGATSLLGLVIYTPMVLLDSSVALFRALLGIRFGNVNGKGIILVQQVIAFLLVHIGHPCRSVTKLEGPLQRRTKSTVGFDNATALLHHLKCG